MSFANLDLEAQTPVKSQPASALSDLDSIIANTSKQLQVLGGLISQLDVQRKQVGSRRDSIQLRTNVDELIGRISTLERAIEVLVLNLSQLINKKLANPPDGATGQLEVSNKQVVIKERLVGELNQLHTLFQRSIRIYSEKKRAVPIREAPVATENTPLIEQQQSASQQQIQQQLQQEQEEFGESELQYHVMLTEERNREIDQVAEGIMEVNSIFKDLGALVNQQGEQLDSIEDNILQLHGNTQQAQKELTKAHEYQKSRSKWSCILLVALTIFVLVVVLAVVS
ncbi:t-SNARE [Suhomyces tanzawaensis NRRL Y-17324]|uniref:t-SNARE n=1 Tax=Suhomyces tanzawaensis NRRL Y-17324 TaxID=984487 RepID=A0A1E4SJ47_9ASCO|nr:t-SNARE [Suhomyces tanzawaensis NRRL Y-17324]ODV79518.1 t-SNARE [Suhomyces tanzawaensis NRRL Y-17324]